MTLGEHLTSRGVLKEMQKSGLALAVVTNIKDPQSLGRIKCKVVTEDKDVAETDWCFVMAPAGGNGYGVFFFPNVDDLIVISYLGSDVHHPVVLGAYWADNVKSPYAIEDGKNEIISIKTPTGSEIKFDDAKDKQKIIITTPSGAVFSIDDEAKTMLAKADGDNSLTLNWKDGEIELKAKTKITLSAGDTKIVIESSGNIENKASKTIKLDAADVEFSGSSSVKADSATVNLNATGELKMVASGTTTVKGTAVQIN
jgi:uncharacterized protein involved in type VI secretion and phage assembly